MTTDVQFLASYCESAGGERLSAAAVALLQCHEKNRFGLAAKAVLQQPCHRAITKVDMSRRLLCHLKDDLLLRNNVYLRWL